MDATKTGSDEERKLWMSPGVDYDLTAQGNNINNP